MSGRADEVVNEVQARARGLVQKGQAVSEAAAYSLVLKQAPALYARYSADVGGEDGRLPPEVQQA